MTTYPTNILFTELVERLLSQRLQRFIGSSTKRTQIDDVYILIRDSLMDVFQRCEFDLSERAKQYIISGYFRMIEINGSLNVFKDHSYARGPDIKMLTRSEIDLLRWLLVGHDLHDEIEREHERRLTLV